MTAQAREAQWTVPGNPLVLSIAAGAAFAIVFTAFGSFNAFNGEDPDFGAQESINWGISVAAILVASLIAWRGGRAGMAPGSHAVAGRRALVFGGLALLSLPVFWLGLYGPFAAAALVLGANAVAGSTTAGPRLFGALGILLALLGAAVCAWNNLFG
jgi:hypothetical protein